MSDEKPDARGVAPTPTQDAVDDATAQLLIELAFLVPRGTDLKTHPISAKLENYKQAIEARAALSSRPVEAPKETK